MTRKTLLFWVICLLFFQPISAQPNELRKVNFLPQWSVQSQFAGYYMAKEKGIYEKHGLDVNIIDGGYGKDVPTYLKEGKADFGTMYLTSAIKEHADGVEVVNIAQIIQESSIMFVAKKKTGIKTIADFNGKKIAVWRTILQTETTGFLDHYSIDAEIIKVSEGVNLLLKDGVDICSVMYFNEYNDLFNYGLNPDELDVFPFKDSLLNFPEDGVYCLADTLSENPELCKSFKDATIEGWEYVFSHPDESLNFIKRKQKELDIMTNLANSRWMLNCMEALIKPNDSVVVGHLYENDFNDILNFLKKGKISECDVDYHNFHPNLN